MRRSLVVSVAAATVSSAFAATRAPAVTLPMAPLITRAVAGPGVGAVAISWAKPPDGGSPIKTYGFSVSVDSGTTWSRVHSFASRSLIQTTASFPTLVCRNATPGSQGCLFRISAANVFGFGAPSKPVALWTAPSAPRTVAVAAGAGFTTAGLGWKPPAVNGGLAVTGYDVLGSMDGAAPQLLATVLALSTTVPCTGKRTCTYSLRAINSHGTSPASALVTLTPAPGLPQGLTLRNGGSNPATALTVLNLAWSTPLTGLPADHYDVDQCALPVTVPSACDPLGQGWTSPAEVFPIDGVPLTFDSSCQAGNMTCLMRVRAVNTRGGAGAWRTIDLEPWAPYSVTVAPGPARGSVTVHFLGPAESGRSGTGTKYYRVIVCDTVCTVASNWRTVSDAVPYLPTTAAPFVAGSFLCRAAPPTTPSPQPRQCRVRMQFVDGMDNAGIQSAAGSGAEHP